LPNTFPDIFGRSKVLTLSAPSAGADFALTTVPGNVLWQVDSIFATLTTSGTAANRFPTLYFQDATHFISKVMQGVIIASQTCDLTWCVNATQVLPVSLGYKAGLSFSPQTPLFEGYKFGITTIGIDAADQWSAGYVKVREWLNPHG
jgi:hypothetical protein